MDESTSFAGAIESAGVHVPAYRLPRSEIAETWGVKSEEGTRAVGSWDEDSLTMAVAAGDRCLGDRDRSAVDMVIVASSTLPYQEKQSAATIAEALDLSETTEVLDVSSSLRGGSQALRTGLRCLRAGCQQVLVVAADRRDAEPGSAHEMRVGDGAVALLLGRESPVKVRPLITRFDTAADTWRLAGERFVRQGDERFTGNVLYERSVRAVVEDSLKGSGLDLATIDRVALAAPNYSAAARTANSCGFPRDLVVGQDIHHAVGYVGVAAGLLTLARAVEDCREDSQLMAVDYGDGAEAFLLSVRTSRPFGRPVHDALKRARPLDYGTYLRFRKLVPDAEPRPFASEIELWREQSDVLRLRGVRCMKCKTVNFPPQRVCRACGLKDRFEAARLPRRGSVFTFTSEHLYPGPARELPTAVIELETGTRLFTQMADCSATDLRVGMPVALELRRLHTGKAIHHYFWKAVPVEPLATLNE